MALDDCMMLCFYVYMRTTIDLPDGLFRKAKAISSLKGLTLKRFITMAIEHELESGTMNFERRKITLPLVPSKRPGSINIDSDKIAKLLEKEDLNVPS